MLSIADIFTYSLGSFQCLLSRFSLEEMKKLKFKKLKIIQFYNATFLGFLNVFS